MNKYIVNLKDEIANDILTSGGKGANLARLHNIVGMPVPDGYVITAQAYKDMVLAMPEIEKLLSRLEELRSNQTEVISQLSEEIRNTINIFEFPQVFIEEISKALSKSTTSVKYAVRSSATAEDLPEASFAGQQDTFLNVTGVKDICDAIVK